MKRNDDALSRREFLEAGAAIGAAALGTSCGGDDESNPSGNAGNGGSAGSSGASGSGGASGSSGTDGSGGSSGSAGTDGTGGSSGTGAGASGAAGTGTGGSSGAGTGGAGGVPPDGGNPTNVSVAIVKRTNIDEAVAKAVELAGGLDEIKAGQTVFIKPNAVSDRPGIGIRTSPEVLAAVVKLVKTKNPGRIIVGDRSARTFPDTAGILQRTGLRDAALAAGADEVYGARSPAEAPDEWVLLKPPHYEESWSAAGGILAMKKIVEADHLINVPTCKDHRYALFSMSMKNFVGAIGDSSRGSLHLAGSNFTGMGRDIAVFNQMFSPLMNVIDCTTAIINGGPEGDAARDAVRASPGLVCASRNRAAIDAFGVSLIKLELSRTMVPTPDAANSMLKSTAPFQMPQIVNAGLLGYGVSGHAAVTLLFDQVPDATELERIYRS